MLTIGLDGTVMPQSWDLYNNVTDAVLANYQIPMKMDDWINKLDGFLQFNDYQVLQDASKIGSSRKVGEIIKG